jgi:HK97 family phage portal protein
MTPIQRVTAALARAVRLKAVRIDEWDSFLAAGLRSKAGITITRDKAFKVAAAFACLRVVGKGIAQVPFKLHREELDSATNLPSMRPAREHPLYDKTSCKPNSWMTSYELRETLGIHAALGNGYVYKATVGRRIDELILLNPGNVTTEQADDGGPRYWVTSPKTGERREVPRDEMWHVRGPSWSGFAGLDIIDLAREALGLSIAGEESHARLHANGVRPTGVYSVEGKLDEKQQGQLTEWIRRSGAGANAHGVLVLDRAAKFFSQAMSGLDAQHLEMRRHQIEEVCRFFDVLPIMIGYSDKTATFASAESFFLAHVVHTLSPWYARIENSADVNLLTDAERRDGYYFKFMAAGLLRGDMKSTADYLTKLVDRGIMVRNEARAKLELNPLPGLSKPLTPVNMTTNPDGADNEDLSTP